MLVWPNPEENILFLARGSWLQAWCHSLPRLRRAKMQIEEWLLSFYTFDFWHFLLIHGTSFHITISYSTFAPYVVSYSFNCRGMILPIGTRYRWPNSTISHLCIMMTQAFCLFSVISQFDLWLFMLKKTRIFMVYFLLFYASASLNSVITFYTSLSVLSQL